MYEQHFGLKNRPFGAKAEGAGVFVGPQQTNIIASLGKGLAATDAVVTVTGPVGVGKTTIVSRALETISPGRLVAWVGRMQLAPDEVLELLLTGFGVNRQSKGTIQRFTAFRRLLGERAAAGAQVTIVVEDAHRIGTDALLELEALTAADAGDTTSANIVLMGQAELNSMLAKPELARLRQRNRLRQEIEALSAAEVNGYLKHCIRASGGDYHSIFADGVSDIIYKCSEGVPRIINTLCETALTRAMDENSSQVSVVLMQQVAIDAFGYEDRVAADTAATEDTIASEETAADENTATDTAVRSNSRERHDMAPALAVPTEAAEKVVPELINDTQPSLQQLDDILLQNPAQNEAQFATGSTRSQELPEALSDPTGGDEMDQEADFSLDAALSVEAEETNVMPGITPNLDQLAAASREADTSLARENATPTEDIPTLSDSMRIDVEVEVVRAKSEEDAAPNDAAGSETTDTENIAAVAIDSLAPVDAIRKSPTAEPAHQPDESVADLNSLNEKPVDENTGSDALAGEQKIAASLHGPCDDPVRATIATEPEADRKVSSPKPDAPLVSVQPEAAVEADQAPLTEPAQVSPLASEPEPEPAAVMDATPEPAIAAAEDIATPNDTSPAAAAAANGNAEITAEDAWGSIDSDPLNDDASVEEIEAPVEPMALMDDIALADASPETPAETHPVDGVEKAQTNVAGKKRMPDIDALEAALDAAKNGEFASAPTDLAAPKQENAAEQSPDIPEITLDNSLPKENPDQDELRKVAEQIGAANSLEDITDVMAETIFGSQALDEIAAAVVANPPVDEPSSPVMLEEAEIPTAPNDAATGTENNETRNPAAPAKLDEAAAQRLDMVKALNKGANIDLPAAEEIEISSSKPAPSQVTKKPTGPQPEPIENQINTSMTQTLKALSSAQVRKADAAAADEKKAGGLFSRFRKSS